MLNIIKFNKRYGCFRVSYDVDLLVVGGGITGAGIALDAISRGLSVVLVEKGILSAEPVALHRS